MKTFTLFLVLFFSSLNLYSQNSEDPYASKVSSIDSIVTSVYKVVSGEKGEDRDWDLHRTIFHPDAQIVTNYVNDEGDYQIHFNDIEEYVDNYREYFKKNDLHEVDVNRKIEVFGNLAHVLSTFESYRKPDDSAPYKQGIASLQLYNDGERWWVVSMYYKNETDEDKIPEEYLPTQ